MLSAPPRSASYRTIAWCRAMRSKNRSSPNFLASSVDPTVSVTRIATCATARSTIVRVPSAAGRLEQLDQVAGRVLDEDLPAAGTTHHVVAEGDPFGLQPADLLVEVVVDEVDAVPAAGARLGAVGHRTTCRALRAAEQQAQIAAGDGREGGR